VLREDKALTNRFLRSHAAIESIRKQIEGRTPVREKVSTSVDLPLSQECKRVLAFAAEEAERLSHKHIGTEHLLLGLLREDKSFAAEIMHERGLRLPALREELTRAQSEKAASSRPKEASLLSEFSRDLTQCAMENQLDPLVGREAELERAIQILSLGSLVSARLPSWKAWRNALRMAMYLPFSPTSESWRWTFL
jgi:ATP-dependent Clp protease ATP-binding subunit ClpC